MTEFKFRDVDLTFNFRKLPPCDQDYLKSMMYEITKERSVKHSGINFYNYYPNADNFICTKLFNNAYCSTIDNNILPTPILI